MDVNRNRPSSERASESDDQDWALEILQALVSPSTAEDAALACAAAWMNFLRADRVSVVVFDSTTQCIVAHGQRDEGHVTVYVGRHQAHFSLLLSPEELAGPGGPCSIDDPSLILCWPEHFSVVLASLDEAAVPEDRQDLVQDLSRKLLSRWTSPATTFAVPEQMEAMAEFAAGAGHEINNPLGSIIGQTQLLLKREDKADRKQALETIGSQAWRIRDMIGDTMLFARPPQPEFANCNLVELARKVVTDLNDNRGKKAAQVRFSVSHQQIDVFADDSQISTLISHLLRNSCEAVEDLPDQDGRILLEIKIISGRAAEISVTDNGPPIPAEIRQHLFNPFFSGRQAGRGLGFGLCHCWQIARMHNGVLTQESLGTGNRFTTLLPMEVSDHQSRE